MLLGLHHIDCFHLVASCLVNAKAASKAASKGKEEGHPTNFGIISPGAIYRSSFPQPDDYPFLASLKLKTIL